MTQKHRPRRAWAAVLAMGLLLAVPATAGAQEPVPGKAGGNTGAPSATSRPATEEGPAADEGPASEEAAPKGWQAPDGGAKRQADIMLTQDQLDELRAEGRKETGSVPKQTPPEPPAAPSAPKALPAPATDKAGTATDKAGEGADDGGVSTKATPPPIGKDPNEQKLKQCYGADPSEGHRFLDRFTYCELGEFSFRFYKIRRGAPPEYQGTTSFRYQVFAQGDTKDRRIRAFSRIVKGSLDYDWGWWDNIWTAPGVDLSIMGNCVEQIPTCGASPSAVTLLSANWDNQEDWYSWDITGNDTNASGRDLISRNRWLMEFDGGERQGYKGGPLTTDKRVMRCDSAGYFVKGRAKYPKACVFPGASVPTLKYSVSDPKVDEVAEHIRDAFAFPNLSYPWLAPWDEDDPRQKRFPTTLHRILRSDPQYAKNGTQKDHACNRTGPYRETGLPEPPKKGQDCDEYPFASTREGAANTYWDFSVRAVNRSVNRSAGTRLKNFYVDNRVLAWDKKLSKKRNDTFRVRTTG